MDELELSRYINLEQRERLIERILSASNTKEAVRAMHQRFRIVQQPHQTVPKSLWHVVPLKVVAKGEGPHGGESERVACNETTLEVYGDMAEPDILSVEIASLDMTTAQIFSSFVKSYSGYISGIASHHEQLGLTYKRWANGIKKELYFMYSDDISKTDRRKLADIDPAVTELEAKAEAEKQFAESLKSRVQDYQDVIKHISRDLERRKIEANIEGRMGFDLNHSGSEPNRSQALSRRTGRGRRGR